MTDDLRSLDLDSAHARPAGVSDEAVAATGKLSEVLERIERTRGALYEFHQLMGGADAMLDDVVDGLRRCGEPGWAEHVATEIKGRNAIEGRWSFQIVEEFDDVYYGPLQETERRIQEALVGGRRHVFEAEMKQRRCTHGHSDHSAIPQE